MPERTCTVPTCGRQPRSATADLCNAHYFRVRRTGKTGSAEIWDRRKKRCVVDECDRPAYARGYCDMHHQRIRKHGDPARVDVGLTGERSPNWQGDRLTYNGAHSRVRSARGSASAHTCITCGDQAQHWAYDHADPNEQHSDLGPYSTDPSHYRPMCVSCHKTFDLAIAQAASPQVSRIF